MDMLISSDLLQKFLYSSETCCESLKAFQSFSHFQTLETVKAKSKPFSRVLKLSEQF